MFSVRRVSLANEAKYLIPLSLSLLVREPFAGCTACAQLKKKNVTLSNYERYSDCKPLPRACRLDIRPR